MKKILITVTTLLCSSLAWSNAITDKPSTIFYGAGHYLAGQPILPGFDVFGYNYQARSFNGLYDNFNRNESGLPPLEEEGISLSMKWNDAWLSNLDVDPVDGQLDRHAGFPSYRGSGAWLTNHMEGSYEILVNGKTKLAHWTYFVKIVAAPSDAILLGGVWYDSTGVEIGPQIWGDFAEIQAVYNDPFEGVHGRLYGSPAGPGFGKY